MRLGSFLRLVVVEVMEKNVIPFDQSGPTKYRRSSSESITLSYKMVLNE